MIQVQKFTFNPFQENTYILYDESKECIIVDPGCFNNSEEQDLLSFIEKKELKAVHLINTHAHIDHIIGNKYIANKFGLEVEAYESEYPMYDLALQSAKLYGIPYNPSPEPVFSLKEGGNVSFGNSTLEILAVPGHAPDHIVLINQEQKFMIGGDVLFKGSIGRTDLPGGNHEQLINNIREKVFTLDEEIVVYAGHGEETTIGEEKRHNPFF